MTVENHELRITSKELIGLHSYWVGKIQGEEIPAKSDIDPIDVPKLLPYIFLVEVSRNPYDFRYRLSGTAVDHLHNQVLTGKTVDEIESKEVAELVKQQYLSVVESRQPVCHINKIMAEDGKYWSYERLILPLSPDGKIVDMLLCGAIELRTEKEV